jgi:Holliday junction resolvasome RuvABC endonuclease subunit
LIPRFLAFDVGLANMGAAVADVSGSTRRLVETHSLETIPSEREDDRLDLIFNWAITLVHVHQPIAICVERHVWQGAARSANAQLPQTARLSGIVEGLARQNAFICRGIGAKHYALTKSEVNGGLLGFTGKVPKSRVKAAVEALYGVRSKRGGLLSNEHECDAAALLWVCAGRWGVDCRRSA